MFKETESESTSKVSKESKDVRTCVVVKYSFKNNNVSYTR